MLAVWTGLSHLRSAGAQACKAAHLGCEWVGAPALCAPLPLLIFPHTALLAAVSVMLVFEMIEWAHHARHAATLRWAAWLTAHLCHALLLAAAWSGAAQSSCEPLGPVATVLHDPLLHGVLLAVLTTAFAAQAAGKARCVCARRDRR